MTSKLARANDPPRPAPQDPDRAAASAATTAPQSLQAPGPLSSRAASPLQTRARTLLLTLRSTARTQEDLLTTLADHAFDAQPLERWEHLLEACERFRNDLGNPGGAVLVDLDEAECSPSLQSLGISAHRLTRLLARELRHLRLALIVVTARDYAEIEDLVRAGVHAVLHPRTDPEWRAEQVRQAVARRAGSISAVRSPVREQRDVVQPAVGGCPPDAGDERPARPAPVPASVEQPVSVAS